MERDEGRDGPVSVVLVIKGAGNQKPGQSLDLFVRGFWRAVQGLDERARLRTRRVGGRIDEKPVETREVTEVETARGRIWLREVDWEPALRPISGLGALRLEWRIASYVLVRGLYGVALSYRDVLEGLRGGLERRWRRRAAQADDVPSVEACIVEQQRRGAHPAAWVWSALAYFWAYLLTIGMTGAAWFLDQPRARPEADRPIASAVPDWSALPAALQRPELSMPPWPEWGWLLRVDLWPIQGKLLVLLLGLLALAGLATRSCLDLPGDGADDDARGPKGPAFLWLQLRRMGAMLGLALVTMLAAEIFFVVPIAQLASLVAEQGARLAQLGPERLARAAQELARNWPLRDAGFARQELTSILWWSGLLAYAASLPVTLARRPARKLADSSDPSGEETLERPPGMSTVLLAMLSVSLLLAPRGYLAIVLLLALWQVARVLPRALLWRHRRTPDSDVDPIDYYFEVDAGEPTTGTAQAAHRRVYWRWRARIRQPFFIYRLLIVVGMPILFLLSGVSALLAWIPGLSRVTEPIDRLVDSLAGGILGDVVAYASDPALAARVRGVLEDELDFFTRLERPEGDPAVSAIHVFAHSQGSAIAYELLYHHLPARLREARLRTLVTAGSPLRLYYQAQPLLAPELPHRFPVALTGRDAPRFHPAYRWYNYWNFTDPITQFQGLDAYRRLAVTHALALQGGRLRDADGQAVEERAGQDWRRLAIEAVRYHPAAPRCIKSPASLKHHSDYWTNQDWVQRPLARRVLGEPEAIDALRERHGPGPTAIGQGRHWWGVSAGQIAAAILALGLWQLLAPALMQLSKAAADPLTDWAAGLLAEASPSSPAGHLRELVGWVLAHPLPVFWGVVAAVPVVAVMAGLWHWLVRLKLERARERAAGPTRG